MNNNEPGGIESQPQSNDKPVEAKTIEEALAPCADCGAVFPSPHRAGCPQIEAQERLAQERDGKKVYEEKFTPHQALCRVKAYVVKIENLLNPELLEHYQRSGVHDMLEDLIKIAGMTAEDAKEEIEGRQS